MNAEKRQRIQDELKKRIQTSISSKKEEEIKQEETPKKKPQQSHPNKITSHPNQVVFSCGHQKSIQKLIENECPGCQELKRNEKRKHEKINQRNQGKKWKHVPVWQREAGYSLTRLPIGSHFDKLLWDGSVCKGTLIIPTVEIGGTIPLLFTAEATSFFRLLSALDRQWRDWLKANGKELEREEEEVLEKS